MDYYFRVLTLALILALRLGPLEAGMKLGEKAVVTSVSARTDAVYVRVRLGSGAIVTYGLAKASGGPSIADLDGARIFYVGEQKSTDEIERGAEMIAGALSTAGLTGEKLSAAISERFADPRRLDAQTGRQLLEWLAGTWRVSVSNGARGALTRKRLGASVLRDETNIPEALSPFSLIGFDGRRGAFWVVEIGPSAGTLMTTEGEWNADEKFMEFRLAPDIAGTMQTVVLRILSPTKHVLEQYSTAKGEAPRLVKSATFER
jgi:hypothetical protein